MGSVCIISGDDDYSRRKRARELALQLGGADPDDLGVEIISADTEGVKPEQLVAPFAEAVETPPFLSPRKMVWMKHFPDMDLLSKPGQFEVLLQLLCSPPPEEVDIIFDAPGFDKRKTWARKLLNSGVRLELFQSPKAGDKNYAENRRQMMESMAAAGGKRLEARAVQYLLETVGGPSANLANEMEKLLLYAGDSPVITLADCETVTSRTPEAVGWEFTAAVTEGNVNRAFKLLDLLWTKDSDLLPLLASLSAEYQRYSKLIPAMKELGITRLNPRSFDSLPADAKSRFPDNPLLKLHPYRAFKMCEAAQKLGGFRIAEKLAAIRDASCAAVSGGGEGRLLLEQLILKLCRNQESRK